MRALAAALALTLTPAPALPADTFFSYSRPATYGVHVERTEVPLRDGSHVVCDIHRPDSPGRFPSIVVDFNAYDLLTELAPLAGYFAERGYAAAVCNVRGSGASPGRLDPFSAQEQRDNYDLIEWLAAQPWATDKVGQMGVSYGGHTSLLVAVNKPPHLAAIIPVDGISDWYENTIYRGGIYSPRIREWQQATAPETLTTYAEHPRYDDFWRERSVKARWADLDVPTLEIAGWYDRYRDGMVANFRARTENVWLVVGPWEHGMPAGQRADIGMGGFLAWWDRWLGGRDAPLPAKKITSFEIPNGGWQQFDAWPLGGRTRTLALTGDGSLRERATPFQASYEVNTTSGPGRPDQRLVFRAPPQRADLVLAGDIEARVRVAFPAVDGNVAVIVSDVAPDGSTTRITQGWLKASHRDGHEHPVPVRPGEVYDLAVHVWPTHYRIAKGHRLEVTIASDDHPEISSDAPAGRVTISGGTVALTTMR